MVAGVSRHGGDELLELLWLHISCKCCDLEC